MASAGIVRGTIVYPETDGLPMAENTVQFEWILKLFHGLEGAFRADENVFVAGDLFWFPVEDNAGIRTAPDIMVAFGRPKGPRSGYLQWEEGGIAPQVVIEIRSPSNTRAHMDELFEFYQTYGVEEYYLYDPDRRLLEGWRRNGRRLARIRRMNGHVSPRLGVRFDASGLELEVYHADGGRFLNSRELSEAAEAQKAEMITAKKRAARARREAEREKRRADDAIKLREELIAKLLAKGINPDTL